MVMDNESVDDPEANIASNHQQSNIEIHITEEFQPKFGGFREEPSYSVGPQGNLIRDLEILKNNSQSNNQYMRTSPKSSGRLMNAADELTVPLMSH